MKYFLLYAFIFVCASDSVVRAETLISAKEIQSSVEDFVIGQLEPTLADDVRPVIDVRWQNDISISVIGDPEIRVRRASSRPLRGPSVVKVGIDVDGKTYKTMSITADVRIFKPVLVAVHRIDRGELIEEDFFKLVESDVTALRGHYFTDKIQLEEMRMERMLSEGGILTDKHVGHIPIVKRGEAIRIVARVGRMEMTTDGTAMQDGSKGDRIRVKNVDSGKTVYGHVIKYGLIQVGL